MSKDKKDSEQIELTEHVSESLASEVKNWLELNTNEGKAKLVKAAIAMRNHNGGKIYIGYENKDFKPNSANHKGNDWVEKEYHPDVIQNLISKYSSEKFEVILSYNADEDGKKYPVLAIGGGVRTPVISTGEIINDEGKAIVKKYTPYVRSLESNNTVSTTEIRNSKDYEDLIKRCFDNREYEIAHFFKRNFTKDEGLKIATELLGDSIYKDRGKSKNEMKEFFLDNEKRYNLVFKERNIPLPPHGLWEIGAIIKGNAPKHATNQKFISLLDISNPRYTGWPAWVNSSNFTNPASKPNVVNGAWEALIISSGLDFWRIYPDGKFFLLRVLEDDGKEGNRVPIPHTKLEFGLAILRTAEAILTVLEFAKAMGYDSENTSVIFGLKWTGLEGRELSAWANPMRHMTSGWIAKQDEVYEELEIPLNASSAAICQSLYSAINQLFNLFGGFEMSYDSIEEWFNKLLYRKLD